jgi:uncharacterized RDD family membrane protein YckC
MNSTTSAPASLGTRLTALVYDVFPLLGLCFFAGAIGLSIAGDENKFARNVAIQVLVLLFSAGYFVISWTRGGQTIGMRAWRLRLIGDDGARIAWPRALLRFVLACFSFALLGAGFWWQFFDREKRTAHDAIAHTCMIREPKT